MTVTQLEIIQKEETQPKPPLQHAYCRNCMRLAAPAPVKAKCGGGKGLAHGSGAGPFIANPPEQRCVVCDDLAGKVCQKCGWG